MCGVLLAPCYPCCCRAPPSVGLGRLAPLQIFLWHLGAIISKLSLEAQCWTAPYTELGFSPSAIAVFAKAFLGRLASLLWACEPSHFGGSIAQDGAWPWCLEMPFVSINRLFFGGVLPIPLEGSVSCSLLSISLESKASCSPLPLPQNLPCLSSSALHLCGLGTVLSLKVACSEP